MKILKYTVIAIIVLIVIASLILMLSGLGILFKVTMHEWLLSLGLLLLLLASLIVLYIHRKREAFFEA